MIGIFWPLLFFVWFVPAFSHAATLRSDIDIKAVVGFQGVIKLERWIPLVITVENRGPSVQGTFKWEVHGGREYMGETYVTTYARHIDLPYSSKKRFKTVVFLNSYTPLVLRLEKGEEVLAEKEVQIPRHTPIETLILGLSSGFPLDFFPVAPERRTQVVYPRLEDLPEQVQGYESVDAIVIHQISLRRLTMAQRQSIEKWVALGGVLIFSSGAQYSLYQDRSIASLLPVEIQGLIELQSLQSLEKKYGSPIATPQPFVVTRVIPQPGTRVIQEGEIPLVVEQKRGRGKIVFLTFDFAQYPFNTWKQRLLFWKDLLQSDAPSDTELLYQVLHNQWETDLISIINQIPVLDFPSHYILVLFLSLYLLALGYFFWCLGEGRWKKSTLWKWGSGVVVVFTVIAAGLLQEEHIESDAVLFQITTVESLPQSDFAAVESQIGLFSTVQNTYDLTFLDEETVVTLGVTPGEKQRAKEFEIELGGGYTTAKDISVPRWGLRTFQTKSVIRFPLRFTIQEKEGTIKLTLSNHTDQSLTDSWLWYRGILVPFDAWKPETTISKEIPVPLTVTEERFLFNRWQQEVAKRLGGDKQDVTYLMRKAVVENFFKRERRADIFHKDRFLFVGWIDHTIPKLRVEGQKPPHEGLTMVKLSFP